MANTFTPIVMKNVDLILGDEATGTNYKCQLRSIKLDPDVNVIKTKTACPEGQYSNVDDPEWTLNLGYLDGTDSTGTATLAEFLREHHGEKMPFFFRPISGGKGYTGTVTLIAGSIGGGVGEFQENSVGLPLDGQPEPVAAVVGP